MSPFGSFSVPDAVRSIAIGDLLFSISSTLVHILEATESKNESNSSPSQSAHVSVLEVPIETGQINYTKAATGILCWIYVGVNLANTLLAILLWQAVIKGCILKCMSYLVISPFVITIGILTLVFHGIVVGTYPHYYAIGMYPLYWTYKLLSFCIISRFLNELKDSPLHRREKVKRDGYSSIGCGTDGNDAIGDKNRSSGGYHPRDQDEIVQHNALKLKLPRAYEISEDRIELDHKTCLEYEELEAVIRGLLHTDMGPGSNSKGDWKFIDVAVKTLKVTTPTIPYGNRLLDEAKLLVHIGSHDHILKFYGVCTKMQPKEKLFLIMEYYPRGKLDNFLKDCVNTYGGSTFKSLINSHGRIEVPSESRVYENLSISHSEFTTVDMVQWAYQIACAMEHLHSKRVVYGYLQTKSVVLIKTHLVKLTGFSFSTKLCRSNRMVQRDELPSRFPWRWTAIECIESTDRIGFTTRSDVWSYGVTLWEIFSLGEVPYGAWDCDIVRNLRGGSRLDIPKYAPCQIYEIMEACWRRDPQDRPNFFLLKLFFQQLLSSLNKS